MMMGTGITTKLKDATQAWCERILNSPTIGIILAILSTIFFPYNYFSAQEIFRLQRDFPLMEVVLMRSFVPLMLCIIYIITTKTSIFFEKEKLGAVLQLTTLAYIITGLGYITLLFISSALFLPLSATSPLFAILFSVYILKDRFFWLDAVVSIAALIGVLFIFRPKLIFGNNGMENTIPVQNMIFKSREINSTIGCILAILFGALKALSLTLFKRWYNIAKDITPLIFYQNLLGTLLTPIIMILGGHTFVLPKTPYITYCLIATSIFTLFGSLSTILAMRTQSPTVVSIIRNLDIIWGFLLQFAFLRVWPSLWSVGGSILIMVTTIVICFRSKIHDMVYASTKREGFQQLRNDDHDDHDDDHDEDHDEKP